MSQLVKTKRQGNFKDFKRFGAFKGLVEQKTLYSIRSCVNWAFFGTSGPLMPKKSQFGFCPFLFNVSFYCILLSPSL
jgi:hypothetical protein